MPETQFTATRINPRFSFIAEAEVTWTTDKTRVVARVSQLSSHGCYVDTVNPFPLGAELHVVIRYGCSTCEVSGKVIYTHSGYGMGVEFGEIAPSQKSTLNGWLEELGRKSS